MNNFLEFINEDIEAKKTLLSSMPTNNKTNAKKYNEKIDSTIDTYNEYKENVKKYLKAKSESFEDKENTKRKKLIEDTKAFNKVIGFSTAEFYDHDFWGSGNELIKWLKKNERKDYRYEI